MNIPQNDPWIVRGDIFGASEFNGLVKKLSLAARDERKYNCEYRNPESYECGHGTVVCLQTVDSLPKNAHEPI
jgi:hypothetical protein